VVLVFRTQRGVDSIVHGKFTLGADASAAAGGGSLGDRIDRTRSSRPRSTRTRAPGLFAGAALDARR